MRGTDEIEKQNDETNGPEAGGRHRHLDGEGTFGEDTKRDPHRVTRGARNVIFWES